MNYTNPLDCIGGSLLRETSIRWTPQLNGHLQCSVGAYLSLLPLFDSL